MKRVLAAFAAASWLVACGGTQPSGPQQFEQQQKPVSPKGSIVGRLLDAATQTPIEGVTVKVLGADGTSTNADGIFTLRDLIVGSTFTFIFDKTGYVRARTTATIPASAGNSPLEGGIATFSFELFPASGSITGTVFLPNSTPAANATVYVDQRNSVSGESVVTGTTGADGSFTLTGLAARPSGQSHTVFVQWFDENGDMQADYGGFSQSVTVFPGVPARIFMTYSPGTQRVVATNLFDGDVAPNDEFTFTLALPVLPQNRNQDASAAAALTNTTRGGSNVPVEVTFTNGTTVKVKPSQGSLKEGDRYSLVLNLANANSRSTGSGTATNFSQTYTFQVRPATVAPFTTQVSGLVVTNPSPTAPFSATQFGHNSTSFTLSFPAVPGAVRYDVFARDTTNNLNYVFVSSVTADGSPRYTTTANPAGPLNVTLPLAGGNRVSFAVVGVDTYGARAPVNAATPVEVRDTIPPTITGGPTLVGGGSIDAINDEATAQTARLRITYSESMDPASVVTFTTTASPAPTATWAWDTSTAGILTLTFAAGADSTGSFVIRGGRDFAGNEIAQAGDLVGSLGGRRELLQNGNFTMGTGCGLGNWTPSNTGGAPAPSTQPNNGAIAGSTSPCAAVLGSVPGTAPTSGRSRIVQDVPLPTLMMTGWNIQASARARPVFTVNRANPGASYTMECRVTSTADALITSLLAASASAADITSSTFTASPNVSLTGNVTVRVVCEAENTNTTIPGNGALYVDEVSVQLVKPGTL